MGMVDIAGGLLLKELVDIIIGISLLALLYYLARRF